MEDLHVHAVEAFIEHICSRSTMPSFEAIAFRLWYNVGWDMHTIRKVLIDINNRLDRTEYLHYTDNQKIKQAAERHRKHLQSSLRKVA